jgi:hypothetical protein
MQVTVGLTGERPLPVELALERSSTGRQEASFAKNE